VCGDDGLYYPVPLNFMGNCEQWYPAAWLCKACCSSSCPHREECAWSGQGSLNETANGCLSCGPGLTPVNRTALGQVCRSCFRSSSCTDELNTFTGEGVSHSGQC
jgi:hypothetical protein